MIDANDTSWLQDPVQIVEGLNQIREVFMICVQVMDDQIHGSQVESVFELFHFSIFKYNFITQRTLDDLNVLNWVFLLFLPHLANHSIIDFEGNNVLDVFG